MESSDIFYDHGRSTTRSGMKSTSLLLIIILFLLLISKHLEVWPAINICTLRSRFRILFTKAGQTKPMRGEWNEKPPKTFAGLSLGLPRGKAAMRGLWDITCCHHEVLRANSYTSKKKKKKKKTTTTMVKRIRLKMVTTSFQITTKTPIYIAYIVCCEGLWPVWNSKLKAQTKL